MNRLRYGKFKKAKGRVTEFAAGLLKKYGTEGRVLSNGCVSDLIAISLAAKGYDITCLNHSEEREAWLLEEAAEAGVTIRNVCDDLWNFRKHEEGQFDFVFQLENMIAVFYEEETQRAAVKRLFEYTAPGGHCAVGAFDVDKFRERSKKADATKISRNEDDGVIVQSETSDEWVDDHSYWRNIVIRRRKIWEMKWETTTSKNLYRGVRPDELRAMLVDAGFVDVEIIRSKRYYMPVVIGKKPD